MANQTITISGTPAIVNFQQPQVNLGPVFSVSGDTIYGQNTATLTDVAANPASRTITGTFTCISQGTVTLTIMVGQFQGAVGGQTAYSQPVICGTGLALPTPTTISLASTVTVAASPTSVGCNGTAFVTVTVRNAVGGYVADGTSVSLSTAIGSLSPTTATTLGGGVLAVFTAPSNQASGTANIQPAWPAQRRARPRLP